jgi:hypothetical protein
MLDEKAKANPEQSLGDQDTEKGMDCAGAAWQGDNELPALTIS